MAERVRPSELATWLMARGRHWVTTEELTRLLGTDRQGVWNVMSDLQHRGAFISPAKGAYVPIPPEYRTWETVPAPHFIDAMMRHLGHAYYVGLLSAAEVYGAAHQRPQVFQVITDARVRSKRLGRVRIEFYTSKRAGERPTREVNTPTGTMRVSTPEVTLLDVVSRPRASGGLSNVATVVAELVAREDIDAATLADVAHEYPTSIASRTGWLLEHVAGMPASELSALARLADERAEPVPLAPWRPDQGERDSRWNVLVNTRVEAEA